MASPVNPNAQGQFLAGALRTSLNSLISEVSALQASSYGPTATRPTTGLYPGYRYYDTTLGLPIWWSGVNWKDATGAAISPGTDPGPDPDPTGPTVELRTILGEDYTSDQDAAGLLNAAIVANAASGTAIVDTEGMHIRCNSPIRPKPGMKLHLGANTIIDKGFVGAALVQNADIAVDVSNYSIRGGIYRGSSTMTGKLMELYGNNWSVTGTKLVNFFGGQALNFGGNNIRLSYLHLDSPTTSAGTGGVRMIGGTGMLADHITGRSGDDFIQFVPITANTHPRYDWAIEDSWYFDCDGESLGARFMIAAIAGPQNTNAMTGGVKNSGFVRCKGKGGNRDITVENTEGLQSAGKIVDKILFLDCDVDGSRNDAKTTQHVSILSRLNGMIGQVVFKNTIQRNPVRATGITVDAGGAEVVLDNVRAAGLERSVQFVAGTVYVRNGGAYSPPLSGSYSTATPPTPYPVPPTLNPAPQPPAPTLQSRIGFVGRQSLSYLATASKSIGIALTGGETNVATALPQAGDMIYVGVSVHSPSIVSSLGLGVTGFTGIMVETRRDATGTDIAARPFSKVATGSETSLVVTMDVVPAGATVNVVVEVLRGVDASTPFDGVTPLSTGSTTTSQPEPSALTTSASANSALMFFGAGSYPVNTSLPLTVTALDAPVGLQADHAVTVSSGGAGLLGSDGWGSAGMALYNKVQPNTVYNPNDWTHARGNVAGDSRQSFSWAVKWDGSYAVPV